MQAAFLNEKDQVWEQKILVREYYTVQEVCTILNVGGPGVYGAIKRGTLRGVRINQVVHVAHDALLAYLSRRSNAPVFDPTQLVIEDIVPDRESSKTAKSMAPEDADFDEDDLDFMSE